MANFVLHQLHQEEGSTFWLTEEQLDLWEHAALLYHNYEWQAAAFGFSRLAEDIEDPLLRSFCLLNTVMILARLGDYEIANSYVKLATQQDVTTSMTAFLAGIVTYELHNTAFAEHCFRICWHSFQSRAAIDFSNVGLKFVLDPQLALHNYYRAKNCEQLASMHTVPAELIFEAPQRTVTLPRDEQGRREYSNSYSVLDAIRHRDTSIHSLTAEVDEQLSPLTSLALNSCVPEPLYVNPKREPVTANDNHARSTTSVPIDRKSLALTYPSFQKRPKTRYIPRDAGPVSNETMSLANFIRNAGQDSDEELDHHLGHRRAQLAPAKTNMVARDPHGEYQSMAELSTFAQTYVPKRIHRRVPEHLNLGASIFSEPTLPPSSSGRDKRQARSKKSRSSSNPKSPILHRMDLIHTSLRKDSGTACAKTVYNASPEVLQPTVYQPPSNKGVRTQRSGVFHNPATRNIFARPQCDQVPPTVDLLSERYIKQQRTRTLDSLEGKGEAGATEDNTYPPWQLASRLDDETVRATRHHGYSPPSPVNTERFFETVLDRSRGA